eukprot:CAMPEP_0115764074 /NCGR_PEP_ID=MMETSP0272-20121206/101874_1 /TAXON_ID=71861 /ORGANISM="Scrippsiella trochoidea, Strain CCMP3099" /LENGTH=405 /DNA_ID=CAMNT_0003209853 /DNA_START=53 /DNA_END=1268 /DNA_ORIENTATION=-
MDQTANRKVIWQPALANLRPLQIPAPGPPASTLRPVEATRMGQTSPIHLQPTLLQHVHTVGGVRRAVQQATSPFATKVSDAQDRSCAPSAFSRARHGVSLTPQQLTDFIRDGFVLIQPQVPLAADSPELVGALTSILGEDYVMTPSRHCHISQAGSAGQALHQDDFFGFNNFRHALPMEAMLMYYPQAVSELMGPTAVIPGSQYSRGEQIDGHWGPQGRHQDEKLLALPKGGTCMLMHWHLWHRGTRQLGGPDVPVRYMFKLQFRRTRPLHPTPPLLAATCAGRGNPFLTATAAVAAVAAAAPPPPQHSVLESHDCTRTAAAAVANYHDLTCASVWAALCGKPLPPSITVMSGGAHEWDAGLAVACGVWPSPEALPLLVSTVVSTDGRPHAREGGPTPQNAGSQE